MAGTARCLAPTLPRNLPARTGWERGDTWILTPSIPWVRGVHGLPAVDRDGAILAKLLLGLVHLANEVDETFS